VGSDGLRGQVYQESVEIVSFDNIWSSQRKKVSLGGKGRREREQHGISLRSLWAHPKTGLLGEANGTF
jgi:hypothetical protein